MNKETEQRIEWLEKEIHKLFSHAILLTPEQKKQLQEYAAEYLELTSK